MAQLAQKYRSEKRRDNRRVQRYWMQANASGDHRHPPRQRGWKAGIASFSEVAKRKKDPGQRRARRPGVQHRQNGQPAKTEIDGGSGSRQQKAERRQRRHRQQKEGITEKGVHVRDDKQQPREDKGGEQNEQAGVPKAVRIEAGDGS